MSKKEKIICIAGIGLILLATIVLYWPVSGFGWISGLDQIVLVDNKMLYHFSADMITDLFFSSTAGLYMPLTLLSLGIDISILQDNPVKMIHIVNLVLHLLNTLLFFRLLQILSKQCIFPLIAAFIFALHPLNLDAVALISSRGILLGTFFTLIALLLYEYYMRGNKGVLKNLSIIALLIALFSHPVGVLYPVFLIGLDIAQGRKIIANLPYKLSSLTIAAVFVFIAILVFDGEVLPASSDMADLSLIVWIIPARFLLPFGISGTQTGLAVDVLQSAYPLVIAMSTSLVYLISAFWERRKMRIASGMIVSIWTIGIIIISFIRIGDWRNSENYWNRVIELYPESSKAYFHRGDYWAITGDFNRAKFDYAQSIKLYPGAYEATNNLGLIYLGENDLQFAIKEFKRSISIKADFYKPHLNLGLAYMRKGDQDLALQSMSEAISLNPSEPIAYYNRGLIHERKDSLNAAILDFTSAIRLDPYRYIFYKDRGKALVWLQRFAEAELDYSKALELNDTDPEMWFRRSLARVSQDKFKEGLEDALMAKNLGMDVSEDYIKGLTRQILEADSVLMK
jgi:tetratricopeptide (TPR) repeat protein